jgi:hypothetical protein
MELWRLYGLRHNVLALGRNQRECHADFQCVQCCSDPFGIQQLHLKGLLTSKTISEREGRECRSDSKLACVMITRVRILRVH